MGDVSLSGGHMEAYDIILQALTEQRVLTCVYNEHPRTVNPFVFMRNKQGQCTLSCWQTDGTSSSGEPIPGWRSFGIGGISELIMTAERFTHIPDDYNPTVYGDVIAFVPKNPNDDTL